jgi:L-sorbose 1-phosphate reductase
MRRADPRTGPQGVNRTMTAPPAGLRPPPAGNHAVIMIPQTQTAVQLVGPDQLSLTTTKAVHRPGPRQILGKVECVGLCQSDMKLLHQFNGHARKTPVLAHLQASVLSQIPTYVPDDKPTVPGHEVVIRVVETGPGVSSVQTGRRYLVQADWRDLKTAGSNGAFGYNFEGGLQQYVLLDERTTVAADGTSYLVPAPDDRSASQIALVEPWACVEEAFIHSERQRLTAGGTLLYVDGPGAGADLAGLDTTTAARRLCLAPCANPPAGFTLVQEADLKPGTIDDILFAGTDADRFERVVKLLATNGLILIAQGGKRFGRPVSTPVGRVHYGNVRVAGTAGTSFAAALATIPATGEVAGGKVSVVGAGGPMGSMAVIRLVSTGLRGLSVEASDLAVDRLEVLRSKAAAVAAQRGVPLRLFNPKTEQGSGGYDYHMMMVPVPALVAAAVGQSNPGAKINIFAGIPAEVYAPIDLDTYCAKGLYFIGTSGSTMEDMMVVLRKVLSDALDTNLSVGAVTGMGGAIAGLTAVKENKIAGKILVYPDLGDFPLTSLEDLVRRHPSIGPKLQDGCWTKAAEDELLRVAAPRP